MADDSPYLWPGAREARQRRVQGRFFYIGEHNLAARFGKSTAQRQPNAARAASHKSSFTEELPHHFALPWIDILNCGDLVVRRKSVTKKRRGDPASECPAAFGFERGPPLQRITFFGRGGPSVSPSRRAIDPDRVFLT